MVWSFLCCLLKRNTLNGCDRYPSGNVHRGRREAVVAALFRAASKVRAACVSLLPLECTTLDVMHLLVSKVPVSDLSCFTKRDCFEQQQSAMESTSRATSTTALDLYARARLDLRTNRYLSRGRGGDGSVATRQRSDKEAEARWAGLSVMVMSGRRQERQPNQPRLELTMASQKTDMTTMEPMHDKTQLMCCRYRK